MADPITRRSAPLRAGALTRLVALTPLWPAVRTLCRGAGWRAVLPLFGEPASCRQETDVPPPQALLVPASAAAAGSWSTLAHAAAARARASTDATPRAGRCDHAAGCGTRAHAAGAGLLSSLRLVSGKSERRAARSVVADYHRVQLGELVARVGEAVDRYRAGELDAFDVDRVLFQYSRAAKELWKFCNSFQVEIAAAMIQDQPPRDWWERAAPRQRP